MTDLSETWQKVRLKLQRFYDFQAQATRGFNFR
jgi:hypothetical protein